MVSAGPRPLLRGRRRRDAVVSGDSPRRVDPDWWRDRGRRHAAHVGSDRAPSVAPRDAVRRPPERCAVPGVGPVPRLGPRALASILHHVRPVLLVLEARDRPGHPRGSRSRDHRPRRHDQGTCARAVVVRAGARRASGFCVLLPTRHPFAPRRELPMTMLYSDRLVTLAGVPLPTAVSTCATTRAISRSATRTASSATKPIARLVR